MYKADNNKIRCIKDNINEIINICIDSEGDLTEEILKGKINIIGIKARSMKTIFNELDKEHNIYHQLAVLKEDLIADNNSDSEDLDDWHEAIKSYLDRIITLEYHINQYFEGN